MSLAKSFDITRKFIETLFQNIQEKHLLQMVNYVEEKEGYLWKHVDYGIRTPVFRNMQWIWYGPEPEMKEQEIRDIRTPLLEVNIHLQKEYFQMWFTLLDSLAKVKNLETLLEDFSKNNGIRCDKGALGELKSGVSAELKACYVLVDHRKSFLPFSIMQAPLVPSIIRKTASGDIYLFEENLVVDVKMGELGKDGLPTYYRKHEGRKRTLYSDLNKCKRLDWLYGIRKGIGVVAEERKDIFHFAVYVPWRGPRNPLIHLKSAKLPFLLYIHRKNLQMYIGSVQGNKLTVELEAIAFTKKRRGTSHWINSSNWSLYIYALEKKENRAVVVKNKVSEGRLNFKPVEQQRYSIIVEVPIAEENRFHYQGKDYYTLELVYEAIEPNETRKLNEVRKLIIPVLIEVK
ncbi:MAG: hypothetical protein QW123_00640 [Desulfurococcaceae archaeon]